jgi:hypothetical protein
MSASVSNMPMSDITTPLPASALDLPAAPAVSQYEQVIQPTRGWIGVNWRELIDGRELLYYLIWRDLKVRYKQAVLGVAWVVVQPIMNMIASTPIPRTTPFSCTPDCFRGSCLRRRFHPADCRWSVSKISSKKSIFRVYTSPAAW